jgi:hypothetical protein
MLEKKILSLFLIVLLISAEPCSVYAETRQECLDRCANEYNIRIQSAANQRDNIDLPSCNTQLQIDMNAAGATFAACMSGATAGYIICVLACGTTGPGVPFCVGACTAGYFSIQAGCAAALAVLQNQATATHTNCVASANQTYENAVGTAQALRESCEQGCPGS